MSYAVPHVGMKVEKLGAYLDTWGVDGNRNSVEFTDVAHRYRLVTSLPKADLEKSRERQLLEIHRAFELMAKVIGGSSLLSPLFNTGNAQV